MNNYIDEVYTSLLNAKEKIRVYTNEKLKNKDWLPYYNGIIESIDDVIVDYAISTKMSTKEILNCYKQLGADNENSVLNKEYKLIKDEEMALRI